MAHDKQHDTQIDVSLIRQHENAQINALLRRLAHESPRETPLSVRQHLRAVIQRQSSVERPTRDRWLLPVAGIAATLVFSVAAVLTISAISNRRHTAPQQASVSPPAPIRQPESPVAIDATKHSMPSRPQPPTVKKRHSPPPTRRPQSLFVVLPFSDPALANGTNVTIRLALSDAELLALGVAPDENKRGQLYVADVVLGDDGLPRAIRLLPNLSPTRGGS